MVNWSVHPDGRFLMLRTAQTPDTAQIVVIENFHEVLEETVPPLD